MSRLHHTIHQPDLLPLPVEQDLVEYPESDGLPMADNTKQFDWIVAIKLNLEQRFADDPEVFVAGDLLWYPVQGEPKKRQAPDVMVAFGRPKGDRGSYLQWREGGVAPQVVFEVLSPGNRAAEMTRKFEFYERYGVEEYYLIDPDRLEGSGWVGTEGRLETVEDLDGWQSPRLGIRFQVKAGSQVGLYHPDGRSFESFLEVVRQRDQQQARAEQEAAARARAEAQAEQEAAARARAEAQAETASDLAESLKRKLLELGVDPDSM